MGTKKIDLPRILELVSAGAVLIVTLVTAVSTFVTPFLQRKYETSAIFLMLAVRVASLLLITLPIAAIAVIVLSGKLREPDKRVPLTVMLVVHGFSSVLVALFSSGMSVYSLMSTHSHISSDTVKQQLLFHNVKIIGGVLLGAVLTAVIVVLVLEAVWKKVSWKSPKLLMALTWVLIVLNFFNGNSIRVYTVFLILLSIFLRKDADTRPEPATGGYIGSFVTVGLALVSFAVSTVYETVQIIAINSSLSITDYNDALNMLYAVNIVFGVLVFLAALTIPLTVLGKKLPYTEE